MFIIHPGADLCQRPGLFLKPKAAGNPAAFLHRETLLRREFLNPCRLRHTETLRFSLWPAATTGLRRTPADGISASLKCGRNLRFPHKRPLPCCEKRGTERGVRSAPIAHSKTDETVASSVFSFCPELRLTHILTQMRKGPERFRKRLRGHSPSHRLPAAEQWWSHERKCPG